MDTALFGTRLSTTQAGRVLQPVFSLLGVHPAPGEFIGAHPVSLTRDSLRHLVHEDFLVCEKSDGIRAILLVLDDILYLYDRNCSIYRTKYKWSAPARVEAAAHETGVFAVFDGELYQEGETYILALFDTLVYAGVKCLHQPLPKRLAHAFQFAEAAPGALLRTASPTQGFRITAKAMMKAHGFHQILDAIPRLRHANDGLVFTPVADPYQPMSRSRILKWKPPQLNTVDFYVVRRPNDGCYALYVTVVGYQLEHSRSTASGMLLFDWYFPEPAGPAPDALCDVVAEFSFDAHREILDPRDCTIRHGGWVLYKIRTDKREPNNIKTALNIYEMLEEGLDEQALRAAWKPLATAYKKRHRNTTEA